MAFIKFDPNVLKLSTNQDFLTKLKSTGSILKQIQLNIDKVVIQTLHEFPRLFFLHWFQVVSMICHKNEIMTMEQDLRKLFPGLWKLCLNGIEELFAVEDISNDSMLLKESINMKNASLTLGETFAKVCV